MFGGQNKPFAFGASTNSFGTTNTAIPFGSSFGAPSGGGFLAASSVKPLFGSGTVAPVQAAAPSMFSTMTAGGASAGNSLFGTATATGSGLFGQPVASPSSGAFGLPGQPATSATTSAFNATPMGSFGFSSAVGGTSSLFGASGGTNAANQTPGLFGVTTPAATTASSLFGGAGSGLFGATNLGTSGTFGTAVTGGFSSVQQGTLTKFEPTPGTDTMMKNGTNATVQTKHQCITAMKAYENKSMEELRFEDYSVGRKGPQPGTTATPGLFASAVQQASQHPATFTGFGTSAPTFSSVGTGGLFVQPQPGSATQGSLFGGLGQPTSQTMSTFGAAPSALPAPSTLFGQGQNASSIYGAATQNKPLFGPVSAASSMFGATSGTPASGGFGTAVPGFGTGANLGLLGANANKQAFGATPAGSFGSFLSPASAVSTGMFTSTVPAQQPVVGLFGQPTATTAGAPFGFSLPNATNSGGLFGSLGQQPKTFGFGSTAAALGSAPSVGGGMTANFVQPTIGNAFGSTFSSIGGQLQPSAPAMQNVADTGRDVALQQHLVQAHVLALTNSPYGDSPLFRGLTRERVKSDTKLPTDPSALKEVLHSSQLKVSSRPLVKLKPRPLGSVGSSMGAKKGDLFDGLDEDSSFGSDAFAPRRSIKKLAMRDIAVTCTSNMTTSFAGGISSSHEDDSSSSQSVQRRTIVSERAQSLDADLSQLGAQHADNTIVDLNIKSGQKEVFKQSMALPVGIPDHSLDRSSPSEDDEDYPALIMPHPAGVKLSRPDYYTIPSMDDLVALIDDSGDCYVEDFTIGRTGYGSVFFPGTTNVAGLDLDAIVHFRRKEVTIYPDDDEKPSLGESLNKRAEVTLQCVWPIDKSTHCPIQDVDRLKKMNYQDKVELATIKIGAKFIDYRPETGSWVFEVKHFSKYGLLDESDEDEVEKVQQETKMKPAMLQHDLNVQAAFQGSETEDLLRKVSRHHPLDHCESMLSDQNAVQENSMCSLRQSPTPILASQHVADTFGIPTESMQRMKASFFYADSNASLPQTVMDYGKSIVDRAIFQGDRLQLLTTVAGVDPKDEDDASTHLKLALPPSAPEAEYPLLRSGYLDEDTSNALSSVGFSLHYADNTVGKQSHVYAGPPTLVDAASFMGKRCRASWAAGDFLIHVGWPIVSVVEDVQTCEGSRRDATQRENAVSYCISIEQVHIAASASDFLQSSQLRALDIQLHHSLVHSEHEKDTLSSEVPLISPAAGVDALHAYAEQSLNDLDACAAAGDRAIRRLQHAVLIWELCVALWGQLPELSGAGFSQDGASSGLTLLYTQQHARRDAFSRWLAYSAMQGSYPTQNDANRLLSESKDAMADVFRLLTAGSVQGACQAAMASGDHRLALLLAQAGTSCYVKQLLQRQLSDWRDSEIDKFVNLDRLKVYALLAGLMLWYGSKATGTDSAVPVNVCQELDWKRALAVHFWYACPANCTVQLALECYEAAAFGQTCNQRPGSDGSSAALEMLPQYVSLAYASPPLPLYLEEDCFETKCLPEDLGEDVRDTCYHLLKLHCNQTYWINRLLNPVTWTCDILDYQLSWHLMVVLQALQYKNQLSESCLMAVHTRYADQLEACGAWQWAVFVLLHIEDPQRRTHAVKSLLSRHVEVMPAEMCSQAAESYSEREQFIVHQLHVPMKFLQEAKAIRASHQGMQAEEAAFLLKCGQPNKAHSILLKHVAPSMIICGAHQTLKELLLQIACNGCDNITNWASGGRIYLDYTSLLDALERLKSERCSAIELSQLQPDILSLGRHLSNLCCPTAQHKLSQAEMAKSISVLIRALMALHCDGGAVRGNISARVLIPHLSQLPLPEDYCLQELRDLVRSYSIEFAA